MIFNNKKQAETYENVLQESTTQEEVLTDDVASESEEVVSSESAEKKDIQSSSSDNVKKVVVTEQTSQDESEQPVFEQIVVQEGSVVEEDCGIRKVGNTVEITREFRPKSPTKYSFKDFGILDNVK